MPVQLIQITDPHLLSDRQARLRGVLTYQTLQQVYADARQRFANAEGYLLTGDLVHDDAGGYALLRECFANSHVPVCCLPGNHDVPEALQRELCDAPFVTNTSIQFGHWLVVLLDSWLPQSAGGELGAAQLAALEHLLNTHSTQHVLLCLHHHPVAMHSHWLDQVGLRDAEALLAVIKRHQNIRGVCWGHVHQALDAQRDGVWYFATPATCSQFLPHSDEFAEDNKPPGYRVLNLLDDGAIESQVMWLTA